MNKFDVSTCYTKLYTIDNQIYNANDKTAMISQLTKLKGEILAFLCKKNNKSKIDKKEFRSLLSNIDGRIYDLYTIKNASSPYKEILIWIYQLNHLENNTYIAFLEDVFYFVVLLLFSFCIAKLLSTSTLLSTSVDDIYVIIFIFVFFQLSKIKSITKDGIEFRKRKNW